MKNFSTGRLSGLFNVVILECLYRGSQPLRNTTRFPNPAGRRSFGNDVRRGHIGGFTLIELLVVVLIIGILSAIALPQYQRAVARSRIATLLPITRAINDAQHRYKLANGEYATDLTNLDISLPGGSSSITSRAWTHGNYECWIQYDSGGSVYCTFTNTTSLPQIEKYYDKSHYACWASKEDKTAISVCQVLSGKNSPDGSGRDNKFFVFTF